MEGEYEPPPMEGEDEAALGGSVKAPAVHLRPPPPAKRASSKSPPPAAKAAAASPPPAAAAKAPTTTSQPPPFVMPKGGRRRAALRRQPRLLVIRALIRLPPPCLPARAGCQKLLVVYDQCGGTAHGCMGLDNKTNYCADKVGLGGPLASAAGLCCQLPVVPALSVGLTRMHPQVWGDRCCPQGTSCIRV
jgi:hypothetical protein